jgi:hypothetical protein
MWFHFEAEHPPVSKGSMDQREVIKIRPSKGNVSVAVNVLRQMTVHLSKQFDE